MAEVIQKIPCNRPILVGSLGVGQIISWGTSSYLPAVLAAPISKDTGWALATVIGAISWALVIAGVSSPKVGRLIDKHGGRTVLASSSILFAIALLLMGLAPGLFFYYLAWTIMGFAMAAGLYDAAFSTLGRLFGEDARPLIKGLTLIAGFASTIAWPTIGMLNNEVGWRQTCFILAAIHITLGLANYLFLIPKKHYQTELAAAKPGSSSQDADDNDDIKNKNNYLFILLATLFTVQAAIGSVITIHLLDLLTQMGVAAATSLLIGSMIGPAQVFARAMEFFLGKNLHPLWSARIGVSLIIFGILCLLTGTPWLGFIAMAAYGAGNGIMTIARGTLPLTIFGPHGYGKRMGLLARPLLIIQALSPIFASIVLQSYGALSVITGMSLLMLISLSASLALPVIHKK